MRISQRHGVIAMLTLCGMCLQAMPAEVSVSIDKSTTYQTMDGNGLMHPIAPWQDCNPFCQDADITGTLDSMITVLGLTLHRYFHNGCEFSPSPGQYVIHGAMRTFFEQAQYLESVAEENNEFYGVCPAILGAPTYMKKNNACTGGVAGLFHVAPDNTLKEDMYDEFGEFCATTLTTIVDSFDIVPYAFSFQNEPMFNEPYPCVAYNHGAHYRDMFKVAAPIVKALGLPTLIYGVENIAGWYPTWENAILEDAAAAPYLDRPAVHGYQADAVTPDPLGATIAPVGGRPLWMTETAHFGKVDTYDAAMRAAERFIGAYRSASISAWIHVRMKGILKSGTGWTVGMIDPTNGRRFPTYWATAQFWRFIRPGMQRIEVNSSHDSLLVVGFKDDRASSMSVIMVNRGSTDHTVELGITGGSTPERFDMRRTTESEQFVMVGTVTPSDAIDVPARSIVSLGCNYIGTGVPPWDGESPVVRSSRRPAPRTAVGGVRVYDLRGRLVSRSVTARLEGGGLSAAAYCVDNGARRSLLIAR
jgi:O-glycosyl hydrolase